MRSFEYGFFDELEKLGMDYLEHLYSKLQPTLEDPAGFPGSQSAYPPGFDDPTSENYMKIFGATADPKKRDLKWDDPDPSHVTAPSPGRYVANAAKSFASLPAQWVRYAKQQLSKPTVTDTSDTGGGLRSVLSSISDRSRKIGARLKGPMTAASNKMKNVFYGPVWSEKY